MKTMIISTLFLTLALTLPASAQEGGEPGDAASREQMTMTMQDMADRMNAMSQQMSRGGMTAESQAQMARQMEQMSGMMSMMSGAMGHGMMMSPEQRTRMQQMRMQMNDMGMMGMKSAHKGE